MSIQENIAQIRTKMQEAALAAGRDPKTILLCAAIALMGYELGLFGIGLVSELTQWRHFGAFLLCGMYSCATLLLFYPLIYKIGLIGGNTWKE